MRLLLFDVDGTLIHCGRQVRGMIGRALTRVYGTSGDLDGFDFSGKVDPQIVYELLSAAGLSDEDIAAGVGEAREAYFEEIDRELDTSRMRVLPGVRRTLEELSGREDLTLGLLTGNWERGARIKLGRVGLNQFFEFGAFGDRSRSRRDLPPRALAAARAATGYPFTAAETVIVGDSVLDVDCALAHGMQVVAVATGWTSEEDLAAAGADWVMPDLDAPGLCGVLPEACP